MDSGEVMRLLHLVGLWEYEVGSWKRCLRGATGRNARSVLLLSICRDAGSWCCHEVWSVSLCLCRGVTGLNGPVFAGTSLQRCDL